MVESRSLRLGIVSSTDVSCGNAAFTEVLTRTIAALPDVDVELLGLDLELTQSTGRRERRMADTHISELAERARRLDAVNIQFEPALLGTDPDDVVRRLEMLLDANANSFVTFHAVRTVDQSRILKRHVLARLAELRVREALRLIKSRSASRTLASTYRRYVDAACSRGRAIIVHAERSARRIRMLHPDAVVSVHPLCMVERGTVPARPVVEELRKRFGLGADATLIGVFGYFGYYKGLDTAIDAIAALPADHHLLVFGRQHPQSIRLEESVAPAVAAPVAQVQRLGLADRVHFLGELSNDDFIAAAAQVDCCWLPYVETDQDSSGIASIAFEVGRRVIASNTITFDETLRLMPFPGVERFDIGNHLELAERTLRTGPSVVRGPMPYDCTTQAALYHRVAGATGRVPE